MSDNEGFEDEMKNLEELLKLCLDRANEPWRTLGEPTEEEMKGRREWLSKVINAYGVDGVQEILEATTILMEEVAMLHRWETLSEQCPTEKSSMKRIEDATNLLVGKVRDLDIAEDFEKIGGFSVFPHMLDSKHERLNIKGAELLGEVVQNHPTCQRVALDQYLMGDLVNNLSNVYTTDEAKLWSLFALSCLIRGNSDSLKGFLKSRGFSGILCIMQTKAVGEVGVELRTKGALLLNDILDQKKEIIRFNITMMDMGFVELLVGLLHQGHEASHEHILSALLKFISAYPPALKACLMPQLEFEQMIRGRLAFVEGKPEFLEEEGYCQSILELIPRLSAEDNLTE